MGMKYCKTLEQYQKQIEELTKQATDIIEKCGMLAMLYNMGRIDKETVQNLLDIYLDQYKTIDIKHTDITVKSLRYATLNMNEEK